MTKTPTLEEFTTAVKESFRNLNPQLSDKDVDDYISGDEAKEEIESRYATDSKRFESGEITYQVFMVGCVSSVAYCLHMMY